MAGLTSRERERHARFNTQLSSAFNSRSLDDFTIGMPPNTFVSDDKMHDSMPKAKIIPCKPDVQMGMSLFRLKPAMGEYKSMLGNHGYSLNKNYVEVAYLADSFPTDSFNNDYGETFLDKFSQAASTGVSDVAQILGLEKGAADLAPTAQEIFGEKSMIGSMAGKADKKVRDLKSQFQNVANNSNSQAAKNIAGGLLTAANAVVAGARVDFPKVWKNSAFTPSYTMTIRLYNPNPSSDECTEKYIIGPVAALLLLGLPQAFDKAQSYKWPFLCKVMSPGIYNLNAAFISNISVIKGGDQQQIAYNQNLGIVDVRIDFGSLYDSLIVANDGSNFSNKRPSLASYLEAMGPQNRAQIKDIRHPEGNIVRSLSDSGKNPRKAQRNETTTTWGKRASEEKISLAALLNSPFNDEYTG